MMGFLRCLFYNHTPERQAIGGMRCSSCGKPGIGFDDFGGEGWVSAVRPVFKRGGGRS